MNKIRTFWAQHQPHGLNYGQQVVITDNNTDSKQQCIECYILGDETKSLIHLNKAALYNNRYDKGLRVIRHTTFSKDWLPLRIKYKHHI